MVVTKRLKNRPSYVKHGCLNGQGQHNGCDAREARTTDYTVAVIGPLPSLTRLSKNSIPTLEELLLKLMNESMCIIFREIVLGT